MVGSSGAAPLLSGIILAAGRSTRMGRPKQLLSWGGRPLLQHVVDAAAGSRLLGEIVIVLGAHAEEIRRVLALPAAPPARVVVNPEYAKGQGASLLAGLRAARAEAVAAVVLLGDQPGISPDLIDTVAKAFLDGERPVVRPVFSEADGRRVAGHPVVLAREVWPELEGLGGDQGARAVLALHPEWVNEVVVSGPAPRDVDTPDDYGRALRRATAKDKGS